jgi:hypothetical protein
VEEPAAGHCIDCVRYSQHIVRTVHTIRTWRSKDLTVRIEGVGDRRCWGLGMPLRRSVADVCELVGVTRARTSQMATSSSHQR